MFEFIIYHVVVHSRAPMSQTATASLSTTAAFATNRLGARNRYERRCVRRVSTKKMLKRLQPNSYFPFKHVLVSDGHGINSTRKLDCRRRDGEPTYFVCGRYGRIGVLYVSALSDGTIQFISLLLDRFAHSNTARIQVHTSIVLGRVAKAVAKLSTKLRRLPVRSVVKLISNYLWRV